VRTSWLSCSPIVTALVTVGIAGCGVTSAVYKMYEGPELAAGDIASLDMRDAVSAVVDGRRVDAAEYRRVLLVPGSYTVTVDCLFGASIMVAHGGFIRDSQSLDVLLQAGHSYSLRCERSYGYGYSTYIWVSDDTVNMAAAGQRKP